MNFLVFFFTVSVHNLLTLLNVGGVNNLLALLVLLQPLSLSFLMVTNMGTNSSSFIILSPFLAGTPNCSSFLFVGFKFTARSRSEMYQASTTPLPSKSKMSKANFTLSASFALISPFDMLVTQLVHH